MTVTPIEIPDVLLVQFPVFRDERGWFQELWNPARLSFEGLPDQFVQDNLVFSRRGVLRGLHYQDPYPQGKLVMVADGEIFDVAVDLRTESATYGKWAGRNITGGSGTALYVPPGFAHGYVVLSETALVIYKCTEVYHPETERSIAWDDPDIGITWPVRDPIVSAKDRAAPSLAASRNG